MLDELAGRSGRADAVDRDVGSWHRSTRDDRFDMDLTGKRILVTGGTGSLGQVLVRRLLGGELGLPKKVIVLSRDEAKQHEMRLSYHAPAGQHRRGHLPQLRTVLEFRIGDVRVYADVCSARSATPTSWSTPRR